MRYHLAVISIIAIFLVACSAPPEDVARADDGTTPTGNVVSATETPIDFAKSTFTFTAYGPGKSHTGTFATMQGVLLKDGERIVGARGTIDAASVKSDSTRLDGHLKTADFFDVERYPTISMASTSISDGTLTGDLTFHGVTKTLSFPVTTTADGLSADVIISLEDFGIAYTGVNDEVRIQFDLRG
jgi:polyisoprenoid-binding protein YceI